MNILSNSLIVTLLILITLSVSASYYRFVIQKDYLIEVQTDCDPAIESCFVWECDPTVDGEDACTGNPEDDTWHFKYFYRNAKNIENCDPKEEGCEPFVCELNESDCEEVQCNEEALVEHEIEGECVGILDKTE